MLGAKKDIAAVWGQKWKLKGVKGGGGCKNIFYGLVVNFSITFKWFKKKVTKFSILGGNPMTRFFIKKDEKQA